MNFCTVEMKDSTKEMKTNNLNTTVIELIESEDCNNTKDFLYNKDVGI